MHFGEIHARAAGGGHVLYDVGHAAVLFFRVFVKAGECGIEHVGALVALINKVKSVPGVHKLALLKIVGDVVGRIFVARVLVDVVVAGVGVAHIIECLHAIERIRVGERTGVEAP